MGTIIDRTKEFYPTLEGATYLQWQDESIPEGVEITCSNVVINGKGELSTSKFGSYWGWTSGGSFHRNFQTPEEALSHYNATTEFFKAQEFKREVQLAIDHGLTDKLAEEFQIHPSTVRRWANGVAKPLPRLRQQIIDFIKKHKS